MKDVLIKFFFFFSVLSGRALLRLSNQRREFTHFHCWEELLGYGQNLKATATKLPGFAVCDNEYVNLFNQEGSRLTL